MCDAHQQQHIGSRWEETEKEGETETESTVDVHLSCIIAANASAAILALETM